MACHRPKAAILAYLHAHCMQVEFLFKHRWALGDMVIWDNRSVVHNAIMDYAPHQRRMHRASVFARQGVAAALNKKEAACATTE
jgi:taurine dioxygenase